MTEEMKLVIVGWVRDALVKMFTKVRRDLTQVESEEFTEAVLLANSAPYKIRLPGRPTELLKEPTFGVQAPVLGVEDAPIKVKRGNYKGRKPGSKNKPKQDMLDRFTGDEVEKQIG